jgi:anaerobic selenocysteine-containing dehydrogenase
MNTFTTVCARDCYDTCSLLVTRNGAGKIASLKGDPDHPITQGFLCPRGAKDHERLVTNRVETPYIRQSANWKPIDWDTALGRMARTLRKTLDASGPESVLYLDYAGNMGLLSTSFPQRLWNVLGVTQTDHALCSKSGRTGIALHYGETYGLSVDDIPFQQLLVFWGFNVAVSAPHIWKLARQARQRNEAKIVAIDPIRTSTAEQADIWIQPRPGTDVALAYGVIHALVQGGAVDRTFLHDWTIGFDKLRHEAEQWTPERLEQVTDVSWQNITQLADLYRTRKPSGTLIGIGLQKCAHGAEQARAVSLIPALLGLHRGFFYSNSAATLFDDHVLRGKTFSPRNVPVVEQIAVADALQRGQFRFVYVNCMNPALTLPNQHALREGLLRDDVYVVVHDTHWTRTADFADVVLPAPTYLEKEDIVIPWAHQYVRYAPQVIQPITNSRDEVHVMRALATRLGLAHTPIFEDPWNALEQAFKDVLKDGAWEDLLSGKLLKFVTKPADRYPTPSGKIELAASQAAGLGVAPLPAQAKFSNTRS